MVEIVFEGMCEGCERADLELDCLEMQGFETDFMKEWTVRCTHQDVCEMWEKREKKK